LIWFLIVMNLDYTKQCIVESLLSSAAEAHAYLNVKVLVYETCATRRGHFNPLRTLVQDTDELWLSPQQVTSFSPHY
jgi:hypothetical protein